MRGDASAGVDVFYNPTPLVRTVFTRFGAQPRADFARVDFGRRAFRLVG